MGKVTPIIVALLLAVGCDAAIHDDPGDDMLPGPSVHEDIPDDRDHDGLPDFVIPAAGALRRLTIPQYLNSVRDLTGVALMDPELPPDGIVNDLIAIGSSTSEVTNLGTEQYEATAYVVAAQVVASETLRTQLLPCAESLAPSEAQVCFTEFVTDFGRRVWRRPVTVDESERYVALAMQAAEALDSSWGGVEFAMAAFLQSPNFIYRAELGNGPAVVGSDGTTDDPARGRAFDDYEMASRLSYAICNSTPSDELLDAAAAGELTSAETLRGHVEQLLTKECAHQSVRGFFDELFQLTEMAALQRDGEIFPETSASLGESMREGLLSTVERWVFEDNVPYGEFFSRPDSDINADLAALHGVEAPSGGQFTRHEDPRRPGLLGQPAFLARYAHPTRNSPARRGKFVRVALLCGVIPPAPADFPEIPEPEGEVRTLRQRLARHAENPCATCHRAMDPIGFGFENFNAVGAWQDIDNGEEVDATGELDGTLFDDARGLGDALANHPDLMSCLVRNFYRYSTGHLDTAGESRSLLLLEREFETDGMVRELLIDTLMSDGFRLAGEPQ